MSLELVAHVVTASLSLYLSPSLNDYGQLVKHAVPASLCLYLPVSLNDYEELVKHSIPASLSLCMFPLWDLAEHAISGSSCLYRLTHA